MTYKSPKVFCRQRDFPANNRCADHPGTSHWELKLYLVIIRIHNLMNSYFGAIVQYPNNIGSVEDYRKFIDQVHNAGGFVVMATDLLALTLLTPPGELGCRCCHWVLHSVLVFHWVMADPCGFLCN